ncbi:MAG: nickel/cobalt efflux transporter RcnA [Methylacidiphilales bacterium]|nr:nickel/cobalt efflux transporter RcnA [Candidatus Methylacidiphilales bacterium]
MNNFQALAQQGALHAWFYIPTAVLLGALHGLEPGHSKTMMAAFIIAIRGTVLQAALLGLCAAFSHSLVIWLLAIAALHYGSQFHAESTEPYFQLGSAVVILGLALWMAWRTHRDIKAEATHGHHHNHGHDHHHDHAHSSVVGEYQDAHELAHATDIERRFAKRKVTHGQIALFGLTGGLLPCPAAFTIVLVCLQLKRFTLGIFMVLAFSAGLALTLVATGALAAWSLRHAERRFSGFGSVARKLPYLSSALLILMSLYIGTQGWIHLPPGR